MEKTIKKTLAYALSLLAVLSLLLAGCAGAGAGAPAAGGPAPAAKAPAAKAAVKAPEKPAPAKAAEGYKFICPCGPTCECSTMSDKPGVCACGKTLVYRKILREDSNYYWFCSCPDCGCEELSKTSAMACACGKELQAFVKKARYRCGCQGCDCNTQSMQPGNCSCGKPMVPAKY